MTDSMMNEDDAVKEIRAYCHSGDLEGNGVTLDSIIDKFLRAQGFTELADAIDEVPCWRA